MAPDLSERLVRFGRDLPQRNVRHCRKRLGAGSAPRVSVRAANARAGSARTASARRVSVRTAVPGVPQRTLWNCPNGDCESGNCSGNCPNGQCTTRYRGPVDPLSPPIRRIYDRPDYGTPDGLRTRPIYSTERPFLGNIATVTHR